MILEYQQKAKQTFNVIDKGECFLDAGAELYLKVERVTCPNGSVLNAVLLRNGNLCHFDMEEEVASVEAKVVII